jgi:anti-sigma regulatory factor (Ser/Thr protein kinase)
VTWDRRGLLHRLAINATAADPEERLTRVGLAREVFRSAASGWGIAGPVLDDLVSVASELVANAIRHNHPGTLHTVLRLSPAGDRVRIEVADPGRRMPHPIADFADGQAEAGRGLLMVEALTERWGATPTATGKTVWAEIALPTAVDVPELTRTARPLWWPISCAPAACAPAPPTRCRFSGAARQRHVE